MVLRGFVEPQCSQHRLAHGLVTEFRNISSRGTPAATLSTMTDTLKRLLHLWAGIRNAPGILSCNVARIALFALASCAGWPSVVCFAVLSEAFPSRKWALPERT